MDHIVHLTAIVAYHGSPWGVALQVLITFAALLFLFMTGADPEGYVWYTLSLVTWVATALRDRWLLGYARTQGTAGSVIDTRWCFSRGLLLLVCLLRL